jgi:hypothetical protein
MGHGKEKRQCSGSRQTSKPKPKGKLAIQADPEQGRDTGEDWKRVLSPIAVHVLSLLCSGWKPKLHIVAAAEQMSRLVFQADLEQEGNMDWE